MGKLEGQVVLITGGNKGIGQGIARATAAEKASLVLAARDREALDRTAEELKSTGVDVLAVATDVTDEAQVEALFSQTLDRFGRLDVLYNNAGAFDGGPLDELSTEAWDKVIAVNLRGPFLCTRAAMRIMKKQGGGRIINIASISAQRVRPNSAPYSTSKHGLWGLTQSTALDGREHGIIASCLHPGNVAVGRRLGLRSDDEPMMTPDDIAQAALLMATLPPNVNMLEAIVLPVNQPYIGRG